MDSMTIQDRINELIAQHGSLRAVARVTGIDVGYLSRLRTGEKANPEKDKLRRLGLRRVVSYERAKSPNAGVERRPEMTHQQPTTTDGRPFERPVLRLPAKVERRCPRCHRRAYHWLTPNSSPAALKTTKLHTAGCANCGHEWPCRVMEKDL